MGTAIDVFIINGITYSKELFLKLSDKPDISKRKQANKLNKQLNTKTK